MDYVCFAGHRKVSKNNHVEIAKSLHSEISKAIGAGAKMFYTGEAGDFDNLVINTLNLCKLTTDNLRIVALHSKLRVNNFSNADEVLILNNFKIEYKKIIAKSSKLICYVKTDGNAKKLSEHAQMCKIETINIAGPME